MRKITGILLIVSVIAAVACSSKKKYGEIREFINEVVATQDEFLSKIDKSENAGDLVSAVDGFGDKLVILSQKSLEIKKRYPDADKWVNDPPVELKPGIDKLNDIEGEFRKVFLKEKVKILIRDKNVQTAFINLNKKMENVKFFQ